MHIHNVICTLTASDFTPKTEYLKGKYVLHSTVAGIKMDFFLENCETIHNPIRKS